MPKFSCLLCIFLAGLSMVLSEVSSVYPAQNKEINSESTTAPSSASLPKGNHDSVPKIS